jgi:hypothetical protein
MYSSSRLVTLCLSGLKFPTSDELEWSEVGQGLVRTQADGVMAMADRSGKPMPMFTAAGVNSSKQSKH